MTLVDNETLILHDPVKVGDSWRHQWFDSAHCHSIMFLDGYFYVLWFNEENPTPKLYFHKSDMDDNIVLAKMSLNKELLAIQVSFTSLLVVDVASRKTWIVEVRNPADTLILKNGIIWSDHGGNSQDLILVTNKGLELFKITPKRAQCKLSRIIAQPAFCYWYNACHRMILLASYQRSNSRQQKNGQQRDVLLMDGFFFKTERSTVPMLELPPPDKAPRFEIGPGISSDGVYLVSVYGHALALVHYTSGDEDLLTVYLMTKTAVERIHCLSLGGIVPSLRISTVDNLVLCHNAQTKQSSIFDLMTTIRSRQSIASIDKLEALCPPSTICTFDEVVDAPATPVPTSSSASASVSPPPAQLDTANSAEWNAVVSLLPGPADLRDFSTLRFAEPQASVALFRNTSTSSSSVRVVKLKAAKPIYSFYYSPLFDILDGGFAYDREEQVMWRLGCNLVHAAAGAKSAKEQVRFLCRRGRIYDFPGPTQYVAQAKVLVLEHTKRAKYALLKLLLDALQRGASDGFVLDYLDALLGPYISEHRRLQSSDDRAKDAEVALQSKALQAMDLAQSPARLGSAAQPAVSRRSSLGDLFGGKLAGKSIRLTDSGVLEQALDLCSDPLEPFGLSSALFSDITVLGMKAKSWAVSARGRNRSISSSGMDTDATRSHSRSIKPVNDCALVQLRRDSRGDLVTTQTEIVTLVWVPIMMRCQAEQLVLWARILTEYMSKLAEEGIARTPAISVLHLGLLFNTEQYSSILGNLRMGLYSDTVEAAFMLLQFSDLLIEEGEATERSPREKATLTRQARRLAQAGLDMLWRLNEKIAVVKWLLANGRIYEAIEMCKAFSSSDPDMSCRFVSGIEFFSSAVKVIERMYEADMKKKKEEVEEEEEEEKEEGKEKEKEGEEVASTSSQPALLLYSVYAFLVNWDSALLTRSASTGKSRLASSVAFPTNGVPLSIAEEYRGLFGYV